MNQRDDLLVWMDLEMTSIVDVAVDSITEIATIITDKDLNIVAEGEDIIIKADMARFDQIPTDVRAIHDKSGIIHEVAKSTITESEAESRVLAFLQMHVTQRSSPLCGNSIYMDRIWIRNRMPKLNEYLHYRNIDVSTPKELAKRWRPDLYAEAEKMKEGKTHRAMDDIKGSIAELKFYRENWLK